MGESKKTKSPKYKEWRGKRQEQQELEMQINPDLYAAQEKKPRARTKSVGKTSKKTKRYYKNLTKPQKIKLYEEFLDWSRKPNSINMATFCVNQGIPKKTFLSFKDEDTVLQEMYDMAREAIANNLVQSWFHNPSLGSFAQRRLYYVEEEHMELTKTLARAKDEKQDVSAELLKQIVSAMLEPTPDTGIKPAKSLSKPTYMDNEDE